MLWGSQKLNSELKKGFQKKSPPQDFLDGLWNSTSIAELLSLKMRDVLSHTYFMFFGYLL